MTLLTPEKQDELQKEYMAMNNLTEFPRPVTPIMTDKNSRSPSLSQISSVVMNNKRIEQDMLDLISDNSKIKSNNTPIAKSPVKEQSESSEEDISDLIKGQLEL